MVSARLNAKSRQIVQEDVFCGDSRNHEEEGTATARGLKPRTSRNATSRQKGRQPARRRNAGKLSRLPGMPLDVLYEIFSLVHPADLLRMSWASKAFRNLLTRRSSRQVWIAAFDNIPEVQQPPSRPKELTEIAYANLLYNLCCMDCGARKATVYWAALVRVCTNCIKDWVTIVGGVQEKAVVALARGMVRSSSTVLPTARIKVPPLDTSLYVFTRDLNKLRADLESGEDEGDVIPRYISALAAKNRFVLELERREQMEKADREAALTAAHNRRIEQILEKLVDQGWGEEISSNREEYFESVAQVKGVKAVPPLTEKEWEEIEVRILDAMRTCKQEIEDRILQDRCVSRLGKIGTIVKKYQRTLDPLGFFLLEEDIWKLPDIRKTIIDGTDEELEACAEEVTSRIPKLTSQILEERTAKISALLPFTNRPDNGFSLATAWVKCGSCRASAMHATDALNHYCPSSRRYPSGKPIGETTVETYVMGRAWCGKSAKLNFSKVSSRIARDLILSCGEDPENITWAEINTKLHRFVLVDNYGYSSPIVGSWRYTFNQKISKASVRYRFFGPDEYPEYMHDPNYFHEANLWSCLHCWRDEKAVCLVWLSNIKQHITEEHEVNAPIEDVDYFFSQRIRPLAFPRHYTE